MEAQQRLEGSLFQEIRKVVEGNNLIVIVGDFNYPDINGVINSIQIHHQETIDFCEDILNQYVKGGTRGGNTLDLVFSNEEIIENLEVGENFGLSDTIL